MSGCPAFLLRQGACSLAWVKDFYDQTSAWWGPNTDWASYRSRAAALAQTLCCYSPADFLLLLERTGLAVERIEVDDREAAFDDRISNGGPLLDARQYVVKLVPAGAAGRAA